MTTSAVSSVKVQPFPVSIAVARPNRRVHAYAVSGGRLPMVVDTVGAFFALAGVLVISGGSVGAPRLGALLSMTITLQHVVLVAVLATAWPAVFCVFGLYRVSADESRAREGLRVCAAMGVCAAVAFLLLAIADAATTSWVDLVNVWGLGTGILLLTHITRPLVMRWHRARVQRRVVIIGSGARAASIHDALVRDEHIGYEVVGFVDDEAATPAAAHIARRMLGSLASLEAMLMRHAVDEVFVALPVKSRYHDIHQALRICERIGVRAKYRADLFDTALAWPSYEPADEHVVTMLVAPSGYRLAIKRLIDAAGAAVLLVLFSPVMLATAIAIKATSPGPVLFAQERYGFNRRRFRMFKFRTMVSDAEQLQGQLEERNELDGPVFKIANDPRITSMGRFLRRTSIDELPQLFNVLRGDMSLVGPRPLPLRDVQRFQRADDMRRCSVRPGLTCLWQISGRNNLSFDDWMRLDLSYIDRWSLVLDLAILARTVPAVLRRTGAH